MVCARLRPAVSGLEQEFPGKVVARNIEADEDRAAQIRALGFATHGLVIYSKDGKLLYKQADHTVDIAAVQDALRQILGSTS